MDLSKADLVERERRLPPGSDQMACGTAIASAGTDEIVVDRGVARYIHDHEFRRPGRTRRRWDARPIDGGFRQDARAMRIG